MVQVYFLLAIMAQITGLKAGKAYHKIVNNHIYEDKLALMRDVQLKREPLSSPKLKHWKTYKLGSLWTILRLKDTNTTRLFNILSQFSRESADTDYDVGSKAIC